jgi:hypothetical protein
MAYKDRYRIAQIGIGGADNTGYSMPSMLNSFKRKVALGMSLNHVDVLMIVLLPIERYHDRLGELKEKRAGRESNLPRESLDRQRRGTGHSNIRSKGGRTTFCLTEINPFFL